MEMLYPLADGGHRTYAMHMGSVTERPGTIEEYKLIGAKYVQRVVDALNNKFPVLLFSPCSLVPISTLQMMMRELALLKSVGEVVCEVPNF
jgi:hypothetical protein